MFEGYWVNQIKKILDLAADMSLRVDIGDSYAIEPGGVGLSGAFEWHEMDLSQERIVIEGDLSRLFSQYGVCCLLHELGHAVDHLTRGIKLSWFDTQYLSPALQEAERFACMQSDRLADLLGIERDDRYNLLKWMTYECYGLGEMG